VIWRYLIEGPWIVLIMQRRRFGLTEDEVPVIGQGSWYLDRSECASVIAALRLGLDLGMRLRARS
jgi:diketogulonate reductase-like aldo/keto reductase